jgi:predicted TIM-barrel fold metal-dependent hydrolase
MGRLWYREAVFMMQKYDNLYGTISAWIDSLLRRAPYQAHQIIGEMLREGLEDRIMWGFEWRPGKDYRAELETVWGFQGMTDELARGFGAPPITEEFKRKLLGRNAARLLGIDWTRKLAARPEVQAAT